jgi:translocation and assembly module TamB
MADVQDPASAPLPPPPPAARRRRRGLRALAFALIAVALLALTLLAALWWSVRSESGAAWLLSRLPGVQVESPQGVLLGDFAARRVRVQLPGAGGAITLDDVAWRGLRLERAPAPLWLRITLDSLVARRIELAVAPATGAPSAPPTELLLPVEFDLQSLRIGELHADAIGAVPLRDLAARVHLGANAGGEHRIDDFVLDRDRLHAQGNARITSAAPLTLAATLVLTQQADAAQPAWSAAAKLAGPLAAPLLEATLRAEPTPQRPAQALDLRAALRPFAAWPLGEVRASATALDLAAFSSAAPSTALTAQVTMTSTAADRPARVVASLTNARAGTWNEKRLPLRSLELELAARPDQPSVLDLSRFTAELGTPQVPAGRMTGQGRWSPERWTLSMTLDALQPSLLDARAPAMKLGGPLALGGSASALDTVDIKGDLAGVLARRGAGGTVQLKLDATANPQRIEVREMRAQAGGARASLSGSMSMAANGRPWAVKAQAALADFDPALWWPGADDSAWRRARHRLNAQTRLDLQVPAALIRQPSLQAFSTLRGELTLTLDKSWLAGTPLSGEATLRSRDGEAVLAVCALDVDGNRLRAEGRLGAIGHGGDDAWDLSVDGQALDRLTPIVQLFRPGAAGAKLAGTLSAQARITGRWPALATQGRFDAQALRVGTLGVQQAQARWTAGTSADAPVEAQLNLTQASVQGPSGPGPSIEALQLQLQGTGRAHALSLRAESKARAPAWVESLQTGAQSPAPGARTVAALQAQGGLVDLLDAKPAAMRAGWRGVLQGLELRRGEAAPLLRIRDVALEAFWNSGPLRITLQPGRAELPVGALRWRSLRWAAPERPGALPQIEVDAELESLRVAPLLARAQPDFGWGGDLSIGARLKLRSAAVPDSGFSADVVVEREAGDLSMSDALGTRALGLAELRLGLVVERGVWTFRQALEAKSLGAVGGTVVVRAARAAIWPDDDAPLEGRFELRVPDVGTWGNWMAPGWRLDGALQAGVDFGGRFGGPEVTGAIEGTRLSVRNFVQGVNVSDGDVSIRLKGSTAHIERFSAKAGSGSVTLAGDASLGASPKAQLTLTAERFQLLGRVDRRIVASGSGQLLLDPDSLAFAGQFGIDEGLIDLGRGDAPKLPDDVEVDRSGGVAPPASAASTGPEPAAAPTTVGRNVALDLRLGLGEKLRVRGQGLDASLRGDLHITSPGGRLTVNGAVRTADGNFAAYGKKLNIDRGIVTFNGPVENPRLDIEATRPNLDIRVGVAITGSAAQPRVRLFSEPELSESEKLSWLVTGQAGSGLGVDTAVLQAAAVALTGVGGAAAPDQFNRVFGLDQVSVRQTDGDVRETVVALGKQLSKNWYVGYERGLNATRGSFQLIYRVAQRVTLRAQSGDDSSLDMIWIWRWQ